MTRYPTGRVSLPFGPEEILDSLGAHRAKGLLRHVEVHGSLASTNERALTDDRPGLLVVAGEQTAGRGRLGSAWSSPPGGMYMSYSPPPPLAPEHPTDIVLLAGLAVADAITDAVANAIGRKRVAQESPAVELKWPNDVLLAGGKAAGVLVQSRSKEGDMPGGRRVVIGVGINVNTEIELPTLGDAAKDGGQLSPRSLCEVAGRPLDLKSLLVCTITNMIHRLEGGLTPAVLEEYRSRCSTVGRDVEFDDGSDSRTGLAVDIAPDGALVIELDGGEQKRITAGEVRHLRMRAGR
jgi:BirA family biotin operon repressor/biotin-[acetyl-CoA-carboxylase] ligase